MRQRLTQSPPVDLVALGYCGWARETDGMVLARELASGIGGPHHHADRPARERPTACWAWSWAARPLT